MDADPLPALPPSASPSITASGAPIAERRPAPRCPPARPLAPAVRRVVTSGYPDRVGQPLYRSTAESSGIRRRLLLGLLDQGASSAANFALVVLVARSASARDFGLFGIGFGILTLALAFTRAVLGAPLVLDLPSGSAVSAADAVASSTAAALAVGSIAASGILVTAFATIGFGHLGTALAVLAVACPFVIVQDTWRFAASGHGRPGDALASDAVWLIVIGVAPALEIATSTDINATVAVVFWMGGAVGACGVLLIRPQRVGLPPPGWFAWLRDRRRLYLGLDALLASAGPLVISIGVAAIAGAATAGALRGAATIFGPLSLLFSFATFGLLPEAVRRSPAHGRRLMLMAAPALATVALGWGVAALALPGYVGRRILGQTWGAAHHVIPVMAIEYFGLAVWVCAITLLRVQARNRTALCLRSFYITVSVLAALLTCAVWRSAAAVETALAISSLVVSAATVRTALNTATSARFS